jgi:hypothetical protein
MLFPRPRRLWLWFRPASFREIQAKRNAPAQAQSSQPLFDQPLSAAAILPSHGSIATEMSAGTAH